MRHAGRDATDAFEPVHPPNVLENYLPKDKHLGDIDQESIDILKMQENSKEETEDELRMEREHAAKPALRGILNLQEMEVSLWYSMLVPLWKVSRT